MSAVPPFGLRLLDGRGPTIAAACLLAAGWTLLALLCFGQQPLAALAVGVAPMALIALARSAILRVAVVVVGGALVLGGSDGVGPAKVAYTAVVLFCTAVSGVALITARPEWARRFRLLLLPGGVFVLVLAFGAALSPLPLDPAADIRGSIFWLVILVSPVLGLDAARSTSQRTAHALVALVGAGTAAGFCTQWLSRRGASSLSVDQWTLTTFALPVLGFALAFVRTSDGTSRHRWLVWAPLAAFIPIAMLITGTRTNLLMLVAIAGFVGSRRARRLPLRAIVTTFAALAAMASLAVPVIAAVAIADPEFFNARLYALHLTLSGNIASDSSFIMRQAQGEAARLLVDQHPLFGYGVGWSLGDQVFDTGWVTFVRIGFVGVAALVLFLLVAVVLVALSARRGGSSTEHTVVGGAALSLASELTLGSPVEDHGFGFALILMFLLVGVALRSRAEDHAVAPASSTGTDSAGARHLAGR